MERALLRPGEIIVTLPIMGSTLSTMVNYGENIGGGIVFYLDDSQRHGLIAAIEDIFIHYTDRWDKKNYAGFYRWSTGENLAINKSDYAWKELSETGTAIGQGAENTREILLKYPLATFSATAAAVASAYRGGGFSDWYLPSKDELHQLYLERRLVGGFSATGYWSSSESSTNNAWYQNFKSGEQYNTFGKGTLKRVRAIRCF